MYNLMCSSISAQGAVMNDTNTPIQEPPTLKEWSNWKRRCFIALLCLLELTMISAVVYSVAALWN